jgi:hypothetical protein
MALTSTQIANREKFNKTQNIPGFTEFLSQRVPYNPKNIAQKAYDLLGFQIYDPNNGIVILSPENQTIVTNKLGNISSFSSNYAAALNSAINGLPDKMMGNILSGQDLGMKTAIYYSGTPEYQQEQSWATNPNNPGAKFQAQFNEDQAKAQGTTTHIGGYSGKNPQPGDINYRPEDFSRTVAPQSGSGSGLFFDHSQPIAIHCQADWVRIK